MRGKDNSHLGAISELVATTWLMKQGYRVFRNASPTGLVDLMYHDEDLNSFLVQVKTIKQNWKTKRNRYYLEKDLEKYQTEYIDKGIHVLLVIPETDFACWSYEIYA